MSAQSPLPPVAAAGFLATSGSVADAIGPAATTQGASQTLAAGGMAIGVAVALAAAQQAMGGLPQVEATTNGVASGGDLLSSSANTMALSFLHGVAPVAVASSITFVASSGGGADPFAAHDSFSAIGTADLHPPV